MRRQADRWLYWYNLGFRDGLTGYYRRRVPELYRLSYRTGRRQGVASAA